MVNKKKQLNIEGYEIDGISIAGHETCIIIPSLNLSFDIGKCPQRAISQQFLFISHGHMDHIKNTISNLTKESGAESLRKEIFFPDLCFTGRTPNVRCNTGLYRMSPPTVIVPKVIKENVEKLFQTHRDMDQSELSHNLIGLDVGEEVFLRGDLKVKAFRTYHVIPSQGYIVYSVKQKLKKEYIGLPGGEIKNLKWSGVEISDTISEPEIAFTGDTMSDFIIDESNLDVLTAKILIVESTYVEDKMSVKDARDRGHIHLSEIINYADKLKNKAILLVHFSARYQLEVIQEAISALPPPLAGRVFALTNGF